MGKIKTRETSLHAFPSVAPTRKGGVSGFPLDRFLQFSGGYGKEGVRENAGVTIQVFPTSFQLSFFLSDAVVPGSRVQLWAQEAGRLPKQETVIIPLNLQNSGGPDRVDCDLSKSGLTVISAVLSSGWVSPLVPSLYDWELTVREGLAKLVLLPVIWTSTVAELMYFPKVEMLEGEGIKW